jgi:hypothetical protein
MLSSNQFTKLNFLFSFLRYSNFSQRYRENHKITMAFNRIYEKIGAQKKNRTPIDRWKFILFLEKPYLFELKRKPLDCETFSSFWPLFTKFCQINKNFFPQLMTKYGHLIYYSIANLMLNSNLFTEFGLFFTF